MAYKGPPPPYGMAPPEPVITHQIIVPTAVGPDPQTMMCPSCHTTIVTKVRVESTIRTHLAALLLCFLFCPLFWIPYCADSCQAANHYCPHCGAYIGTHD